MDPQTLHIELDLELAGDGLTGRASDGHGGEPAVFDGWLGLMSVLDVLVARRRGTAAAADAAPDRADSAGRPSRSQTG